MSYRNERMARKFVSLDRLAENLDLGKSRIVSDNGAGARQIRRAIDGEAASAPSPSRGERLAEARARLWECGLGRLVPVLDQIVLNGRNRRESIGNLAMKRHVARASAERFYDRGVRDLLTFFSPNEIKGETHIEKSPCL